MYAAIEAAQVVLVCGKAGEVSAGETEGAGFSYRGGLPFLGKVGAGVNVAAHDVIVSGEFNLAGGALSFYVAEEVKDEFIEMTDGEYFASVEGLDVDTEHFLEFFFISEEVLFEIFEWVG